MSNCPPKGSTNLHSNYQTVYPTSLSNLNIINSSSFVNQIEKKNVFGWLSTCISHYWFCWIGSTSFSTLTGQLHWKSSFHFVLIYVLSIFSASLWPAFSFSERYLSKSKSFKFWWNPIHQLLLYWSYILCPKKFLPRGAKLVFFFLSFIVVGFKFRSVKYV